MGGFGSGQQYGRTRVEQCRFIDIRDWSRKGLLKGGNRFLWTWWSDQGEELASIGVWVQNNSIELAYTLNQTKQMKYEIQLNYSDCHYGGERAWFMCRCFKRVAKLYLRNGIFACRDCHNLTYRSCQQSGSATDQAINTIWRIQKKLGYNKGDVFTIPSKPKHMHWTTYDRLTNQLMQAQWKRDYAFVDKMRKLIG